MKINNQVSSIINEIKQLDAGQMQEIFERLSKYFYENQEELDNFNALDLASTLDYSAKILENRSGN